MRSSPLGNPRNPVLPTSRFDRRLKRFVTAAAAASLGIAAAPPIRALDVQWDAGSTANLLWNTPVNWSNDLVPTAADNLFFLNPIPNPGSLANPSVITLGTGEVANSLSFFANYTLAGGDLTLTAGNGGAVRSAYSSAVTVGSKLMGTAGLTKEGSGTLILSNAANSYTGTTTINNGTVVITDQHALGNDASPITISGNASRAVGGGALVIGSGNNNLAGSTITRDFAITGGGVNGDGGALYSVGNHTFSGNLVTGGNPAGISQTSGVPITLSGTRLTSTFGTATLTGGIDIEPSGQTTQFNGNGAWIVNSVISGAGTLEKAGNGLMVLNASNTFTGTLTVSDGFLRVTSAANLGASTASNAVDLNAGVLEIRTDAPDFANKKVRLNNSSTVFVDRAINGTGLNQTVKFGALTLIASRTMTINGRNGYGLTFTGAMVGGSLANPNAFTISANGLVTFDGTFWNQTNTSARIMTVTVNTGASALINGNVIASGAAHSLTKSGAGTLTIIGSGTGSTYTGGTTVTAGTLAFNDFRALNNAANSGTINLGSGTSGATISVIGNNSALADLTTNKTINLAGTTGSATILANQTGTSPGVVLNSITATGGLAADAKILTLGGANTQDNTINGAIPNNALGGTVSLSKTGAGTWVLAGSNSYTGTTTISQGTLKLKANAAASTIINDGPTLTFNADSLLNAGGTLEFVGQNGVNNVETLGALTPTAGANTIKLTPGTGGRASLIFTSLGGISSTSGTNIVGSDANNTVTLTGAATGLVSPNFYFAGSNFAYSNGGVLRAPNYTTDAGFKTSATALTASMHNEITGSFSASSITINSLKINGAQTLTLNASQTLTINNGAAGQSGAILATGGASKITGGTGISTAGAGALVIRVDGSSDVLTIESPLTSGTTGGLTKNGAGTLILTAANAQSGATNINEGTVQLSGTGRLSAANVATNLRQDATLDLNGTSSGTAIGTFSSAGTVTNSNAVAAVLQLGNNNATAVINGNILETAGQISVIKLGTGGQNWNGLNTYTGTTNIGSTGIVTITNLDDIGSASGIGKGNGTSTAANAASLVFSGASATQGFGGLSYAGTASLSTDRLFTFGGTVATSGARIQSNGVNNATLVFSNTNPLVFSTGNTAAQGLVLGGASIGDNQFNPRIIDNPNAAVGTAPTSLYKSDAGLWILGNTGNSYTGLTQLNAGALRADGTALPTASPVVFAGGVLQTSGSFTRSLVTTPTAGNGGVNWSGTLSGGFAASTSKLTVNLNTDNNPATLDTLTWGTGGFAGGTLILSSSTSLADVEVLNNLDLNAGVRTIQVDINSTTSSDWATLSGVISGATGSGLTKTGSGILYLSNNNTYTGNTLINAGVIRAASIGNSTSTSSSFGIGANKISLGSTTITGTLSYIGGGESTNREIDLAGTTASTIIEASGSGALILSNIVNTSTGTTGKTLFLRGDSGLMNEITAVLANNVSNAALSVTHDEMGTWILSGDNTYSGNTSAAAGLLGFGSSSTGPVGAVTSGPIGRGKLTVTNATVFAANGDRTVNNDVTLTANATSNFVGQYSLTLNGNVGTNTGGNTTVTNMIQTGKFLTINSPTFTGTEATGTARTLVFNGSGDTILNSSVTNSLAGGAIAFTYQGSGSLTLGGTNGASTYTGATTITSGTVKLGSDEAIPSGVGKGDVTINPGAGLTATLDLNGHSQTVNGLAASAAGSVAIDNSSAAPATFTFGTTDKAVAIAGRVTNTGGGALSINKTGSAAGTMTQGPFSYTGTTTVSGGSLTISSNVSGTTGLTIAPGSLLSFAGGLSASSGISSVNVGAGAELRLFNGLGEPLQNLTTLTLGAGSILDLNAGATSDTLTLLSGHTASVTGAVTLNIRDTGSMLGGTTYNLLVAPGGGLLSTGGSSGSYVLNQIPGGFTSLNFVQTDNLVSITTGTLIVSNLYWTGANNTVWNAVDGSFNGINWSSDKSGSPISGFIPGAGSTVVFQANSAAGGNVVTTLEQGFRINGLEFEASTNTPSSVTINPGADLLNRLTIAPATPTGGINLKAGGPTSVTIAAPVGLGANQTWTTAAGTTLTVSGSLSGPGTLTKASDGMAIISAAADPTFAGAGVTVNGGTLQITNVGSLGTTALGNAAPVTINAGGTFYYNGVNGTVNSPLTLAGGILSAGGGSDQHYNGLVTVSANSTVLLNDNATNTTTARNLYLDSAITGSGKLTVDSVSTVGGGNQITGGFILTGDNSAWSGGLQLNRGTVYFRSPTAWGTGAVNIANGRFIFDRGVNGDSYNFNQPLTLDCPSGTNAIIELQVNNNATTLTSNFTVDFSNTITLGGPGGATPLLRFNEQDVNSAISVSGNIILAANGSFHSSGNAAGDPKIVISGVISETGGSRSLTINGDTLWASNNYQVMRLSGANTFTGDLAVKAGVLEFGTVSNIGGPASNLGRGSNISLGGTLRFVGDTASQTTDRPMVFSASSTLDASGTNGATITYNGNIDAGTVASSLTLIGSGAGVINGNITQSGTAVDLNVNGGTWTLTGTNNLFADDIIVTGTGTGSTLNLNSTGVLNYTAGTSNGLYLRDGAVVNLNANDVNGVANANGLDFIFFNDTGTNPAAGTLNTNGNNLTVPRIDLGSIISGRAGIVTGAGTLTVTYTGTDYAQGIRLFEGSIAANLAGVSALLKQGIQDVTLSGDNSGLTGTVAPTRLDSGNLILNYATSNATKLSPTVQLDMRGAGLILNGGVLADTVQNVASFTLANGGANYISVNNTGAFATTLNLGAITRGTSQGTVRFTLPASGAITTTTANNATSGLLGGYATVKNASGTFFAANDGTGKIVAATTVAKNDVSTWLAGDHITDSGVGYTGTIDSAIIGSLRFDAAGGSTVTLGSAGLLGLASGGILMTNNVTGGNVSINGGTLSANVGTELFVFQDSPTKTLTIGSSIRVGTNLTKAGTGTLILNGNNTFTGATQIQAGTVQVSGGNGIGDNSPVTLADDQPTLLQFLDDETIGRLAGGSGTTGLDQLAVVDLGSHTLTISQGTTNTTYGGLFTGTGNLIKNGAGNLQLSNASPGFTGTIAINTGLFYFSNLGSTNATSIALNHGSLMIDNNGTTSLGTHILDTASLVLNSADGVWSGETKPSGLVIRRDQASTQNETVGLVSVASGANYARLDASVTGAITAIIADDIARTNNATFDVRGTNMSATANRRAQIRIGTAANQTNFINAMIGGASTTLGTKNISIVPWAIAEEVVDNLIGDANMGNSLATYVAGQGFRALNLTTEYNTFATKATAQDNIRQSLSADLTGITGQTINALVAHNDGTLPSVSITGTGAAQTLTNTSGAFLFTVNPAATPSGAFGVNLGGFDGGIAVGGTNEYIFHVINPSSVAITPTLTATINSALISAADITKSGRGTLVLNGVNVAGGGARKTTLNEGTLEITDLDNIGGNTGGLVFAGGTLRLSAAYGGDDISTRTITLLSGGGTLDTNNHDLVLANTLGSGAGGFTKTGAGVLTLNAPATYAGGTSVLGGSVVLGANNAIGTGDLTVNNSTLDLVIYNVSAGTVSVLGANPVVNGTGTITASGGYALQSGTIHPVLAGSGGLTKTSAATVTLDGLSTFSGGVDLQAGTISFNTIGNVGGPASALGRPTTAGEGVIHAGLTTSAATLIYTGTGSSSDRLIGMQGSSGGVTLQADGTGAVTFGGVIGETIGSKTLTLQGSSASNLVNSVGSIRDDQATIAVLKSGTNTWVFTGTNVYAGSTSLNDGILRFATTQSMTGALNFGSTNAITTAGTLDLTAASASFGSLVVQTNSAVNTSHLNIGASQTVTINGNVTIGSGAINSTTLFDTPGGGTFTVNNANPNGTFVVGASTSKTFADFSGLSTLTIGLDPATGIVRVNPTSGTNTDDRYSVLTLPATGAGNTTITANQFIVGDGGTLNNSAGQQNKVLLGSGLNSFKVNQLNIGIGARDVGSIAYATGNTTGSIKVRAADGVSPAAFNMGTGTATTGVASSLGNLFDVTGHDADLLFDAVNIGTQNRASSFANVFSFNQGSLGMNSLVMSIKGSNLNTTTSTMNLGGGTVNIGTGAGTAVTLATNTGAGVATAVLNITGGLVTVTGSIVKGNNTGTGTSSGTVNLAGGNLNMAGNTIGSATNLIAFTAASGTLQNLGQLNGGGAFNKTTTGTLNLAGSNSYTGPTRVQAGVLNISGGVSATTSVQVDSAASLVLAGGNERVNNSAPLTLAGGTFGFAPTLSGAIETMAGLSLTSNSTITFGIGDSNTLVFSGLTLGGFTINVTNWTGGQYDSLATADSGVLSQDRLLFSSSVSGSALNQIVFWSGEVGTGFIGTGKQINFGGNFEIVPVPEPSSTALLGAASLFALLGGRQRRRSA